MSDMLDSGVFVAGVVTWAALIGVDVVVAVMGVAALVLLALVLAVCGGLRGAHRRRASSFPARGAAGYWAGHRVNTWWGSGQFTQTPGTRLWPGTVISAPRQPEAAPAAAAKRAAEPSPPGSQRAGRRQRRHLSRRSAVSMHQGGAKR